MAVGNNRKMRRLKTCRTFLVHGAQCSQRKETDGLYQCSFK